MKNLYRFCLGLMRTRRRPELKISFNPFVLILRYNFGDEITQDARFKEIVSKYERIDRSPVRYKFASQIHSGRTGFLIFLGRVRVVLTLSLFIAANYSMEHSEAPRAAGVDRSVGSGWTGSYEQSACFCLGASAFLASQGYLFARATPNEQFPMFRGFGPELAYPIEYLQAASLTEFLVVLCCCAHHRKPDHSCCLDATCSMLNFYCNICDAWALAMGWPIYDGGKVIDRSSWAGNMWDPVDLDGLPINGGIMPSAHAMVNDSLTTSNETQVCQRSSDVTDKKRE